MKSMLRELLRFGVGTRSASKEVDGGGNAFTYPAAETYECKHTVIPDEFGRPHEHAEPPFSGLCFAAQGSTDVRLSSLRMSYFAATIRRLPRPRVHANALGSCPVHGIGAEATAVIQDEMSNATLLHQFPDSPAVYVRAAQVDRSQLLEPCGNQLYHVVDVEVYSTQHQDLQILHPWMGDEVIYGFERRRWRS